MARIRGRKKSLEEPGFNPEFVTFLIKEGHMPEKFNLNKKLLKMLECISKLCFVLPSRIHERGKD